MNVCTVFTENSFQCTSYKISQWKWIMNRLVILFSVISIGGFAMVSEIELSELQMYNNWFCNEQVHPFSFVMWIKKREKKENMTELFSMRLQMRFECKRCTHQSVARYYTLDLSDAWRWIKKFAIYRFQHETNWIFRFEYCLRVEI